MIQTLPAAANQSSLFARALQFASRLCGPVLAHGVSFWQLGECNYWGHNAIIRTRAFIDHCGLPPLRGRPPLGGEILSHDFVEAALLRRAGDGVYFVPDFDGSYEELPNNIIDYATRDRRWCQGNLQHLKILGMRGTHPISRLNLLLGAYAYLSSPVWILFLLLSTAQMVGETVIGHAYFPEGYALFPEWPESMLAETVSLFGVTMAMLLLPKAFGFVLALADGAQRRRFGGGVRLSLSLLLETVFSVLMAPVMGVLHSWFVMSLLFGRGVGWAPQNRSTRGLRAREAFSALGLVFAAGVAWGLLILMAAPDRIWWVLPVLAGLVLSIPLAVLSSRDSVGLWLRRRGLLLTPEESEPPTVLRYLRAALARHRAQPIVPVPATGPLTPPAAPTEMLQQAI